MAQRALAQKEENFVDTLLHDMESVAVADLSAMATVFPGVSHGMFVQITPNRPYFKYKEIRYPHIL